MRAPIALAMRMRSREDFDLRWAADRYRDLLRIGLEEYDLRPAMVFVEFLPGAKTMGRAIKIKKVKKNAPTNPPNKDALKAAESARAASPLLASGKPSSTVA